MLLSHELKDWLSESSASSGNIHQSKAKEICTQPIRKSAFFMDGFENIFFFNVLKSWICEIDHLLITFPIFTLN